MLVYLGWRWRKIRDMECQRKSRTATLSDSWTVVSFSREASSSGLGPPHDVMMAGGHVGLADWMAQTYRLYAGRFAQGRWPIAEFCSQAELCNVEKMRSSGSPHIRSRVGTTVCDDGDEQGHRAQRTAMCCRGISVELNQTCPFLCE
jgi:hypothetical protein